MKFFICKHCKNIIAIVDSPKGVPVMCCGEKMQEIIPGTVDASKEKHIPVISVENNIVTVKVGSVEHPMTPEHFISWIAIETTAGKQRKILEPTAKPEAKFALLDGEKVIGAYAYCNLHGLWKAEA